MLDKPVLGWIKSNLSVSVKVVVDKTAFLTWNRLTATAPSDSDLTANGVTFREKVIELKTATTVKA